MKCDVCGQIATCFARDVYRIERDGGFRFSPVPHVKCGCDDHPQESKVVDLGIEGAFAPVRVMLRNEFDREWGAWT